MTTPAELLGRSLRHVRVIGYTIIFFAFGGITAWAVMAPLAGASIAPGVVSPDTSRKTVQHLEGGIIRAIEVREGDRVEAGRVLFRLETAQAQSNFSARREQWLRSRAVKARLDSHDRDLPEMDIPADLLAETDPDLRAFLENQRSLFHTRRQSLRERQEILEQQTRQLNEQRRGKEIENDSLRQQLALLQDELRDRRFLIERNLARRPEFLAVQRQVADIEGRIGSNIAAIASFQERAAELALQMNFAKTQFVDHNGDLLMRINNELAQIEEALRSTGDVLRRTEIVAPVTGTVVNLRFRTVGGVVRPGEPIVDVVPSDEALIIDARLPPTDIDVIRAGQNALVHLVPYLTRDTPLLPGTVIHVGADSNVDTQTQQRYYDLKVRVDQQALRGLASHVVLTPGMPAEIYVVTRNRTAADYFIEPVLRSFRRAFREE